MSDDKIADANAAEAERHLEERGEDEALGALRWLLANGLTINNPDIFRACRAPHDSEPKP